MVVSVCCRYAAEPVLSYGMLFESEHGRSRFSQFSAIRDLTYVGAAVPNSFPLRRTRAFQMGPVYPTSICREQWEQGSRCV